MRNHTLETLPAFFSHFSQTILISQKTHKLFVIFCVKRIFREFSKNNNYSLKQKQLLMLMAKLTRFFISKTKYTTSLFSFELSLLSQIQNIHSIEQKGREDSNLSFLCSDIIIGRLSLICKGRCNLMSKGCFGKWGFRKIKFRFEIGAKK